MATTTGTTTDNSAALPGAAADALKLRFKQRCTEIGNRHRNWQIRVHRSLSWMKRAGAFTDEQAEARFLFLWIGLNSLYSGWDADKNAPGADTHARDVFLKTICRWDATSVTQLLKKNRGLIKKLLENPYLAADFWRQPEHSKAKGWATADANYIDRNLKNGDLGTVLTQAMNRLFVFRGQLVHGASSGGSRLNRGSLKYCLMALEQFLPVIIKIVIEQGCHDEWPELCYPPMTV